MIGSDNQSQSSNLPEIIGSQSFKKQRQQHQQQLHQAAAELNQLNCEMFVPEIAGIGSYNDHNNSENDHDTKGSSLCHLWSVLAVGNNDVDHKFSSKRKIDGGSREEAEEEANGDEKEDEDEEEEETSGMKSCKAKAAKAIRTRVFSFSAQTLPRDGPNSLIINIIQRNNLGSDGSIRRRRWEDKQRDLIRRHELSLVDSTNNDFEEADTSEAVKRTATITKIPDEAEMIAPKRSRDLSRIKVRESRGEPLKRNNKHKNKATQMDSISDSQTSLGNGGQQQLSYSCLMRLLYSALKYVQRKLIRLLFFLIALLD